MYSIKLTEATFKIIVVSNDSKISRNLPWFCRAGDFNKDNNLFCELHVCHKLNFLFALDRLQILQGVNNITKCLSLADGLESEPNRPIYFESSGTIFKASTFNLSRMLPYHQSLRGLRFIDSMQWSWFAWNAANSCLVSQNLHNQDFQRIRGFVDIFKWYIINMKKMPAQTLFVCANTYILTKIGTNCHSTLLKIKINLSK